MIRKKNINELNGIQSKIEIFSGNLSSAFACVFFLSCNFRFKKAQYSLNWLSSYFVIEMKYLEFVLQFEFFFCWKTVRRIK